MTRPTERRGWIRVLTAAAAVAGVGLPASWLGGGSLLDVHVQKVTGRARPAGVTCFYCHRRTPAPQLRGEGEDRGYLSPADLAVSPDGRRLYVAAEDGQRLLEVDLAAGRVSRELAVPGGATGVDLSADGRRLAVARRDRDSVWIVDATTLEVVRDATVGPEPQSVALAADGERAFVADAGGGDVALLAPDGSIAARLPAGMEPYALALSPGETVLAVSNRRVRPVPEPRLPSSEVTLIDPHRPAVLARRELPSAHLSEGVAVASDGSFALVPVLRIRNFLPTTQVARGALMNSALALVETGPDGGSAQFPLDEVNRFFADPSDVALTPDDRLAFVSHGGADVLSVVDVSALRALVASESPAALAELADDLGAFARYVVGRIPTGANPRALAISPDGRRLYVAERLDDSIAVVDTERLAVVDRIDLGGRKTLDARRRGERVFHNASVTFQSQFSCRSCHPDGHTDGLNWDFEIDGIGQHRLDTRSLRGVRATEPLKWNGKNPDLATQCGPRFARVLTRAEPFHPDDLRDLVEYIESIPLPVPRSPAPELAEAWSRGRALFDRSHTASGEEIPKAKRCNSCHRPPLYTDRLRSDVGSGGLFDTPHLLDVRSSPPYLHDGRAATLEEIWTVYNPDDTHGMTNDLTKVELNELILFLRSL